MSSLNMVEAVVRRLAAETEMVTTRLLGYAYRRVLQVDHGPSEPPDDIIRGDRPAGASTFATAGRAEAAHRAGPSVRRGLSPPISGVLAREMMALFNESAARAERPTGEVAVARWNAKSKGNGRPARLRTRRT
jgi:hypothetical protein